MSWLDNIKSDLVIRTGDGKEYKPQFLYPSKSIEYNVTTFEFPNVSGSLVDKRLPKGTKYPLQLFFQGDNYLEVSEAFIKSAADPRPWILSHPFYGRINVQPLSLEIDNTKLNVSEIKTEVIETILQDYPKTSVVPQDKIQNAVEDCNDALSSASIEKIKTIGVKPLTINKTSAFINKTDAKVNKVITDSDTSQQYVNDLNIAKASVNNFSAAPDAAVTQTISLLQTMAALPVSVTQRLNDYTGMLADAQSTFLSGTVQQIDKFLYMTNVGGIISAMCLAASKPITTDYSNRVDVLASVDVLLAANTTYIQTLDGIQSANGGSVDSFIPDANALQQLNVLLNYTVANLFVIAMDAKQERSIILEEDSNWIVLAHRFYGLKQDDSTIEELIKNNNAGLNEMLQVRKNRKIVYYV